MKELILRIFIFFGYRIQKIKPLKTNRESQMANDLNSDSSMSSGLKRLREIEVDPSLIIDIGAAKGNWTQLAKSVWPDRKYILIEPMTEQIEQIPANLTTNQAVKIIEAVAGETSGTVHFNISDDLDGSGIYGESEGKTREVKVVRLDDLTAGEEGLFLLKLDTHGYEIPIFEGAMDTLEKTVAIIVEVYGFHVSPTGKLFHELSQYLAERNFRLFDILDVMRRPGDQAFWQADAVYLKNSHPVFTRNKYQ